MRYSLLALLLCGCTAQTPNTERRVVTDNQAYEVKLLFTTDSGVQVYRFSDYGNTVYFTDKGDVTNYWTESVGDTTEVRRNVTKSQIPE